MRVVELEAEEVMVVMMSNTTRRACLPLMSIPESQIQIELHSGVHAAWLRHRTSGERIGNECVRRDSQGCRREGMG